MQMMPKTSWPQRVASEEAARASAAPDVVVISIPGDRRYSNRLSAACLCNVYLLTRPWSLSPWSDETHRGGAVQLSFGFAAAQRDQIKASARHARNPPGGASLAEDSLDRRT